MNNFEEEEEEYEVEDIIDDIIGEDGRTYYQIRWKNYPPEKDTYEPIENLANCTDILTRYMDRKKKKLLKQEEKEKEKELLKKEKERMKKEKEKKKREREKRMMEKENKLKKKKEIRKTVRRKVKVTPERNAKKQNSITSLVDNSDSDDSFGIYDSDSSNSEDAQNKKKNKSPPIKKIVIVESDSNSEQSSFSPPKNVNIPIPEFHRVEEDFKKSSQIPLSKQNNNTDLPDQTNKTKDVQSSDKSMVQDDNKIESITSEPHSRTKQLSTHKPKQKAHISESSSDSLNWEEDTSSKKLKAKSTVENIDKTKKSQKGKKQDEENTFKKSTSKKKKEYSKKQKFNENDVWSKKTDIFPLQLQSEESTSPTNKTKKKCDNSLKWEDEHKISRNPLPIKQIMRITKKGNNYFLECDIPDQINQESIPLPFMKIIQPEMTCDFLIDSYQCLYSEEMK